MLQKKLQEIKSEIDADDKDDNGGDDDASSYAALRRRVDAAALPPEASKAVERELRKIKNMEQQGQLV